MIYIPRRGVRRIGRGPGIVPSPPPSGDWPNLPGDYTLYGDFSPTSLTPPSGWAYSGISAPNDVIIADSGPAQNDSLRILVPAGTTVGAGYYIRTGEFSPQSAAQGAFFGTVFRLSSNFIQHTSGTKFVYPWAWSKVGDDLSEKRSFEFSMLNVVPGESFKFRAVTYTSDPNGSNRPANVNDLTLQNGTYYRLEMLPVIGTSGGSDGILRWWISEWSGSAWGSPILCGDYSNVKFNQAGAIFPAWAHWFFEFFFGGSDESNPTPADQYVYINRVHLSLKAVA